MLGKLLTDISKDEFISEAVFWDYVQSCLYISVRELVHFFVDFSSIKQVFLDETSLVPIFM